MNFFPIIIQCVDIIRIHASRDLKNLKLNSKACSFSWLLIFMILSWFNLRILNQIVLQKSNFPLWCKFGGNIQSKHCLFLQWRHNECRAFGHHASMLSFPVPISWAFWHAKEPNFSAKWQFPSREEKDQLVSTGIRHS